ncbi:MAG: hypothetical protein ACKOXB_04405 [Flavobacteriales bacterium]
MESTSSKIANTLISGIKKAQVELEEFQLQLALGKAEAKDKYEDVKKKFDHMVHETKLKVNELKGEKDDLQSRLQELQLQLALGKADSIDAFIEQKKKITQALNKLELELKNHPFTAEVHAKLQHEIERFKIKLEILRLHFELKKDDIKEEFEGKKAEFLKHVEKMKEKISSGKPASKAENFSSEIKNAYKHLSTEEPNL